jgi:hypothetical protein
MQANIASGRVKFNVNPDFDFGLLVHIYIQLIATQPTLILNPLCPKSQTNTSNECVEKALLFWTD